MSMASALENFWSSRRHAQQQRLGRHERVASQDEPPDSPRNAVVANRNGDEETPGGGDSGVPSSLPTATIVTPNNNNNDSRTMTRRRSSLPRGEVVIVDNSSNNNNVNSNNNSMESNIHNNNNNNDRSGGLEVLADDGLFVVDPEAMTIQLQQRSRSNTNTVNNSNNTTVTLEELQEERELARRRTGACVLCAVFVLFLLWIEALTNGDFGQLLLCLVGTSWTARWIRHNREREEELDRRIALYLEHAEPGTTELNRSDLRMLSFQAQLALAIMESQRQMMMGNFGHPDGHGGGTDRPGVSQEARQRWERFTYKTVPSSVSGDKASNASSSNKPAVSQKKNGDYGMVVPLKNDDSKAASAGGAETEEEASCSICLSEYEEGESLVCLPCRHVYHEECVSSWTTNHTRCPLCNYDLESTGDTSNRRTAAGAAATLSSTTRSSSSSPRDPISMIV